MKGKEKQPYHRCAVMTMSLQFLAHETIEGVSLGWPQIPSSSKTNSFHGASHSTCVFLIIEDVCCTRALTLRKVKNKSALGSTALRSLLPAARLALSAKKSPGWIEYRRTGVGDKTGPWIDHEARTQTNVSYKTIRKRHGWIKTRRTAKARLAVVLTAQR
ncbi:hypothetical protein Q5P01_013560 [Channa striata]|uniref:Uncharacterized protein n=1 Tax=Channa striata TaxID=64152 RepID=A0AA88SNG9_CHASR|nr:hypothetical protein Q5P01_013560 [Channa striata]